MKAAVGTERPLDGVRICLVFEHSLSHYTRLLLEIEALRDAGATIHLVTSHPIDKGGPPFASETESPLLPAWLMTGSSRRWRPLRIAENLAIKAARPLLHPLGVQWTARRRERVLRSIAQGVDLFWVIDFPSLPTAMKVARETGKKLVYETLDLVPEFEQFGERHRQRSLESERRYIGSVDGFITVCDSYADYYMERYGGRELFRPPLVRNDMPGQIMDHVSPTKRPLGILFLGSLMFDRPIGELIEAVAQTKSDVTLTFQGKNYLGDQPAALIAALGLEDRVRIAAPCPPDRVVETASEYDIGIVALAGSDENERRASTTKVFTYMAAGLAILGSNLPGIARVVGEHENGVLVDGMTPHAWAHSIDELSGLSDQTITAMKQRSLDAARCYAWELQKPAYVAEFRRAVRADDA